MLVVAAACNELTVARFVSGDGILESTTTWTIRGLQALLALSGIILLAVRPAPPRDRLSAAIGFTACFVYIAFGAWYAFGNPQLNWDMLPYIASAMSYEETNVELIHRETYEAARQAGAVITGNNYMDDMAANADHFHQQLPGFQVKPLYIALIYAVHKTGISYVNSSVLISVISSCAIFWVIAIWLARFTEGVLWGLLTICSAGLSGLIPTARLSTPDGLSALLILGSLFVLIERQAPILSSLILAASLLARPDNLILALVVITYLIVVGPREYALSSRMFAFFALGMIVIAVTVNLLSGFQGWWAIFNHSFRNLLGSPQRITRSSSISSFTYVLYTSLTQILLFEWGWAFLGLCVVLVLGSVPVRFRGKNIYSHVALALALALIARLAVYPQWSNRFFVAYYAFGVIALVQMSTSLRREASEPPPPVKSGRKLQFS